MLIVITALLVILLDQASKYAIYYGHVVNTLGFSGSPFDLVALKSFLFTVSEQNCIPKGGSFLVLSFTPNDAALFGIGNSNAWAVRLLASLTSVFLFLLLFFAVRTHKKLHKSSALTFGLLIGGSIGNLFDRIAFGYVRDMIYAKFIDFPVFNVADAAICIAIALLVLELLFRKNGEGLFDVVEDDVRDLFRLPTREAAEALQKERKAKRLSRFEEEILDEPREEVQQTEERHREETAAP